MALTLTEAAKLSTDMLQRGVIETIAKESPILANLPFLTVEGNSYRYNQENTLGSAGWYAVGDTWGESAATFTEATADLTVLGGDVDVDNFVQQVRSNMNDQKAIQVAKKAKAMAHEFETQVIHGDGAGNKITGLATWYSTDPAIRKAPASQVLTTGANGGALVLDDLDRLIDAVRPSKPDALILSRRSRRQLKSLMVANAHYVEASPDAFGRQVMMYDGIPVFVSDFIADNETLGTGAGLSSIYAVSFGPGEALCGLQNGGLCVEDLGSLETKDASRVRIKWYVGLACFNHYRCARLAGLSG